MTEALGYGQAISELEGILAELEVDDADVDVLAVRVRRAAELIRTCRDRIDAARFEVEQVVAGLDSAPTIAEPSDAEPSDAEPSDAEPDDAEPSDAAPNEGDDTRGS